jgi:hypothetical protein
MADAAPESVRLRTDHPTLAAQHAAARQNGAASDCPKPDNTAAGEAFRGFYNLPVVASPVGLMRDYRCYLMTGENIYGVQNLEGTDDAEVIAKAAMLLLAKPEHQSIEIWDGKRMVARVPRQPDFSNDQ